MQTNDLIRVLASDLHVSTRSVRDWLGLCLSIGFVVSAALFWLALGPRDDIATAAATPRFVLKVVEMVLLAATTAILALRLARPAASARGPAFAVSAAAILLVVAAGIELLLVPAAQWSAKLIGSNAPVCLTAIPLLSLPLLASVLYALRQGAPTTPSIAGATAGVLAGAMAAVLYALHCTDDSPLFVATWYSLAIAGVTVLGWAAGQRVLRW
jgi:hypothetical protein